MSDVGMNTRTQDELIETIIEGLRSIPRLSSKWVVFSRSDEEFHAINKEDESCPTP